MLQQTTQTSTYTLLTVFIILNLIIFSNSATDLIFRQDMENQLNEQKFNQRGGHTKNQKAAIGSWKSKVNFLLNETVDSKYSLFEHCTESMNKIFLSSGADINLLVVGLNRFENKLSNLFLSTEIWHGIFIDTSDRKIKKTNNNIILS